MCLWLHHGKIGVTAMYCLLHLVPLPSSSPTLNFLPQEPTRD